MHKKLKRYKKFLLPILCLLIIVCVIGFDVWKGWAQRTGYIYCIKFEFSRTAENAFQCGNHYFGVYGSSGYNVIKAEDYFGRAVALDETLPDAWHQYARAAFLRGDYAVAMYRINKQFEMRGDELMASYYIRGLIEGYSKDYVHAEQDFKKYIESDRNNWAARNDLAWIYFVQGKYKDIVALIHGFANTSGTPNPWLLTMDAMALYNLGDSKTALAELYKARDAAAKLTGRDWIHAYPGNDPAIATKGLAGFRQTIEDNIVLVENKQGAK